MRSHGASCWRAMWQNLSASSLIERTWLNGNNLYHAFHLSHDWRWRTKSNGHAQICLFLRIFFDEKIFLDVWSYQTVYSSNSMNILISSSSRLIYASGECLKSRFNRNNREKSSLECQNLSSKSQNEKPLIWQSFGSFRARLQVRLHVFLLIFCHVSLDFNFES